MEQPYLVTIQDVSENRLYVEQKDVLDVRLEVKVILNCATI